MSALPADTTATQTKLIQRALNEKTNSNLTIDGDFGAESISVLEQFQQENNLPATGVYDAATQALLGPFITQKYLSEDSFEQAAQTLGISSAAVQAVCEVETSGAGFFNNGQATILFERSQFYRMLCQVMTQDQVDALAQQQPDIVNSVPGGYIGGEAEYGRLQQAQAINSDLALRACSWGLFQIMGYYYIQCGYTTVEDFVNSMQTSETLQLDAFVTYMKDQDNGEMVTDLATQNWTGFALLYNGEDEHAENDYDGKLAEAFAALTA
jgi:hypothetical protein